MNWDLIFSIFYYVLTYGIFTYSIALVGSYIFIGLYSIGETRKYLHKNSFTDYRLSATSPHAPSVSVLAPAYNEAKTIVDNVRSLLSIYYNNLELIIINDGSKDDTLQRLIDAYQLKKVDYFVDYLIPTKPVKGIYRSSNPVYHKLIIVDKENGGKADALNVGINIASNNYLICIDVDCILEQDALLKMIKPFMEQTDARVIASGGVIRVANSCEVKDGRLMKVRLPEAYLPKMQALEYIRAFILGRMAWSRLNGLMLISGAFGAFDREIVIRCGGYNHNTVGEDMELVVRMRRYMEEQGVKYKVTYIPDPLCWTEVPESNTILGRQRNRWTRGMIETLKFHRIMFFNPRYHRLGMISYPYWLIFEMWSPLIEFFGFICFFLFALLGLIDWGFFFSYLLFVICFGYLYSSFAILMEVITYNQYKRRTDILRLLLAALTEPFYFHPLVVWHAIQGYKDRIKKKKGWGEMKRKGFTAAAAGQTTSQKKSRLLPLAANLYYLFKDYLRYSFTLLLLLTGARIFELISDIVRHGIPQPLGKVIALAFIKDLAFFAGTALWGFILFVLLSLLHKKAGRIAFVIISTLFLFVQIALSQYFLTTLVPLGGDLWSYSWTEIQQTIGAAGGISLSMIIILTSTLALVCMTFIYLPRKIRPGALTTILALFTFISATVSNVPATVNQWMPGMEYSNNLSTNKSYYFYTASVQHFFPAPQLRDIYSDAYSGDAGGTDPDAGAQTAFHYPDEQRYPFWHTMDTTANTLSPFFNKHATPPNIVIVLVEGLGRAFTNKGAYLGNFTPFLDSLSEQSLYWENFLSEGGRTFAVLPSVTGSLPFGRNGFDELGAGMPAHLSLLSLLKLNGYHTSFYYGGDAHFDNMDLYLEKNGVTSINDEKTFPPTYTKMPAASSGFTWGYGDKELFRRYFETKENAAQPYLSVLLTVSTHSPFLINEQDIYLQKFEQRMNTLGFDEAAKKQYRDYRSQYASILFMDDALHDFFSAYKKRADFDSTVFFITGDHRMPEIPMSSKLDRYHVPLMIYSPLLARTARFSSVSTHFDITPSLLMWLGKDYHLQIPSSGSWVGSGLDTARTFRNVHAYPLMQTKNDMIDYIMGEHLLNGNDLYRINSNMQLTPEQDEDRAADLKAGFERFRQKNEKMLRDGRLLPDSVIIIQDPRH